MATVGIDAGASGTSGTAATKFERAYLQLYEPSRDATLHKPGAKLDRVEFQFNPRELTLAKQASWAREKAAGSAVSAAPQFLGPDPSTLNLEMFLDASEKHDKSVVDTVDVLFRCCVPTAQSHDQDRGSPPWVIFRWGGITGFLSYIASVSARYTLFTPEGVPIRAVVAVVLKEIAGEPPRQNPTSGGLVPRRRHVMADGDTLAGLAYREYGRADLWRAVARANDIDDPFRIRTGTTILLPAVAELTTGAPPTGTRPPEPVQGTQEAVADAAR